MSQPQEDVRLTPETISVLKQLKSADQRITSCERDLKRQPAKLDSPKRELARAETSAAEAAEVMDHPQVTPVLKALGAYLVERVAVARR